MLGVPNLQIKLLVQLQNSLRFIDLLINFQFFYGIFSITLAVNAKSLFGEIYLFQTILRITAVNFAWCFDGPKKVCVLLDLQLEIILVVDGYAFEVLVLST